jgi:hypothetical protein
LEAREQDDKKISLDPTNSDIKVLVGSNMSRDVEEELVDFLKKKTKCQPLLGNIWKHEDMTGISKDIIRQKLVIDRIFRPIHQKTMEVCTRKILNNPRGS